MDPDSAGSVSTGAISVAVVSADIDTAMVMITVSVRVSGVSCIDNDSQQYCQFHHCNAL